MIASGEDREVGDNGRKGFSFFAVDFVVPFKFFSGQCITFSKKEKVWGG